MILKNLTKVYSNGRGVFNVNVNFQGVNIYAVMGHNGSGKTSLFRVICGLLKPTSGKIIWDDVKTIPYIPERRSLYIGLTVKEHIYLVGRIKKMSEQYLNYKYKLLMDDFSMWKYENNIIESLSKGNQQKVQFIIALLTDPDLLILDEPFTGLDIVNIKNIKQLLTNCSNKGMKIIISSHQYDEIDDFADHILLLKEGHTVLQGNLYEIKNQYSDIYISVSNDRTQKYINHSSVISVETHGHTSRYKIKKDGDFINNIVSKRKSEKIIIESISIKDLVADYYD